MLLSEESKLPPKEEAQEHSAENVSHDKETDLSDTRQAGTSREEIKLSHDQLQKGGLDSVKDSMSVVSILKLIEVEKNSNSDMSVPLRTSEIKLPTQKLCSSVYSCINSETIMSSAVINSMYRTSVFEGNWESQSSKVILVQVQSVIATLVMTLDLEDFTKVIQGIVEDVVSMNLKKKMSQRMRLWYFLSSVNSFFKHACVATQWG